MLYIYTCVQISSYKTYILPDLNQRRPTTDAEEVGRGGGGGNSTSRRVASDATHVLCPAGCTRFAALDHDACRAKSLYVYVLCSYVLIMFIYIS